MIVNDWVEDVRETLAPGVAEQVNRLDRDYIPGDGEVLLERPIEGLVPNQVITCGLNTFLVWSVDAGQKLVTVEPSWAGSPDVVMEEGSLVRMRPFLYTHRIFKAINDTINELSSPMVGMFAVATQDIDFNAGQLVYDLSECEQIDRVLRVQWGFPDDTTSMWRDLNYGKWQHRQMQGTDDFPSGHQLRLFDCDIDNGSTIRVIYGRYLSTLDSLEHEVSASLLPETAWDIPPLGAAASLSTGSEYRRNLTQAQGDTRRANEVPPYALLNAHKGLRSDYERRCEQEAARLLNQFPPKMR